MIKKFFCLTGLVLCVPVCSYFKADWARYGQWNQDRREAEQRLDDELQAYQACATGRCWNAAVWRQEQLVRLGAARVNAIRILQQKPGPLTTAEEQRLEGYSALFGRISTAPINPVPTCVVGARCPRAQP